MSLPQICRQCGRLAFPGPTVTIPEAEYQELLQVKREHELATLQNLQDVTLASRSQIGRDPEVAAFVLQQARSKVVKDIHEACLTHFGAERTPSRSSIYRYLKGSPKRR